MIIKKAVMITLAVIVVKACSFAFNCWILFHLDKMICFFIKIINMFLSYFYILEYDDFSVWFIKSSEWRSVLWVDDRRESLWTCLLQEVNKSFIFIRCVLQCHSEKDENWFELNKEWSSVILWRKMNVCSIKKMFVKMIDLEAIHEDSLL